MHVWSGYCRAVAQVLGRIGIGGGGGVVGTVDLWVGRQGDLVRRVSGEGKGIGGGGGGKGTLSIAVRTRSDLMMPLVVRFAIRDALLVPEDRQAMAGAGLMVEEHRV